MKNLSLGAVALAFAACFALTRCGRKEEPPASSPARPSPAQSAPPAVQSSKAESKDGLSITMVAKLEGSAETQVQSRVSGYLIRQDYQEGAFVKKGDLLFELDDRASRAALEKVKAELAAKQAPSASPIEIEAARAAVAKAQDEVNEAKISAPCDGVAGRASSGLGDLISPGVPLATLSTVDPIKPVFALPRNFYFDHRDQITSILAKPLDVRPQGLELILSDGTPYSQKGRWNAVDSGAANSIAPAQASALFADPDGVLHTGDYVKIRVSFP